MDEDDIEIDLGFDDEMGQGEEDVPLAPVAEVKQEETAAAAASAANNAQPEAAAPASASTPAVAEPSTRAIVPAARAPTPPAQRKEGFGNVVSLSEMAWYTTDIEVEAACSQFGPIVNLKFFEDRSNGRSMGSCIVEFGSHEEARACIDGLHRRKVGDRDVHVTWPGKNRGAQNMKPRAFDGMRGHMGKGQMGPAGMVGVGMDGPMGPMGPMGGPFVGMGPMGMMGGRMGPMGPMRPGMMPGRGRF